MILMNMKANSAEGHDVKRQQFNRAKNNKGLLKGDITHHLSYKSSLSVVFVPTQTITSIIKSFLKSKLFPADEKRSLMS